MTDIQRTVQATFVTNSPGPERALTATVQLPEGSAVPPLLVEDPSPQLPGGWRRVSGPGQDPAYIRLPRIAAP